MVHNRYVWLYNHHIPQKALGHVPPIEAMKRGYAEKPELFIKVPRNRPGPDTWVRAVNARGGFGVWCWDVVKAEPSKVDDILLHHAKSAAHSEPIGEGVLVPSPAPIEMPESA